MMVVRVIYIRRKRRNHSEVCIPGYKHLVLEDSHEHPSDQPQEDKIRGHLIESFPRNDLSANAYNRISLGVGSCSKLLITEAEFQKLNTPKTQHLGSGFEF